MPCSSSYPLCNRYPVVVPECRLLELTLPRHNQLLFRCLLVLPTEVGGHVSMDTVPSDCRAGNSQSVNQLSTIVSLPSSSAEFLPSCAVFRACGAGNDQRHKCFWQKSLRWPEPRAHRLDSYNPLRNFLAWKTKMPPCCPLWTFLYSSGYKA